MADDPTSPVDCAAVFVVSDLAESLRFYEHELGFDVAFTWGEPAFYAGVCRGAATIHLNHESNSGHPAGAATFSLFVGDADAIYKELVERGTKIAVEPDDRPYGLRDFAVVDPDGNRLIFGSTLDETESE